MSGSFPRGSLGPENASIFSSENTDSVPVGQAVGTEVTSFLAVGVFPKVPIGKFQIIGIFMSCALDQICAS